MKPTQSMDARIQVILDSRTLATVNNYLASKGVYATSVSDLVRKSIQILMHQATDAGHKIVSSRDEAQSILSSIAQQGNGFDTHPVYKPFTPKSPTTEDEVQAIVSLHPEISREMAMRVVLAKQGKV